MNNRPYFQSLLRPPSRTLLQRWTALVGAAALPLLVLTACGGGSSSPAAVVATTPPGTTPTVVVTAPVDPVAACAALNGLAIDASQISLPSTGANITTATYVAATDAGNLMGDYCRVRGLIHPVDASAPDITVAVNLPTTWNSKAIHFGGGGFDGTLIDGTEVIRFGPSDKPAPLALGYVTYGDDAGHQSGSITDGTFAVNDESLANYGGNSLKKTHDVAALLIRARYGSAPAKAYFLGTSTGGRDALTYIQRWPTDYNGVIANEPALNYTGVRLHNVAVGRALYLNAGAGWVNLNKTLLVQSAVLKACDKLDGAADGVVSNVESCRQLNSQILASLRCAGGTDNGDTCLSDPQLATIQTIESPLNLSYTLANSVTFAGGFNLLEGSLIAGPFTSRDLGTRRVPGNPATTADSNMYLTGDQWAKYFVTRIPGLNTLSFDPNSPGLYTQRVSDVSAITDATNPDLSGFLSKGSRLIMLHGLADEVIPTNSTIAYYNNVVATVGQAAVDAGIRFYTVPGMGHGTGVFIPGWDSLAALENWVERGISPGTGMVADAVAGTYGRTRPLCQYPAYPRYKGSGSMDAAINYSCTSAVGNPLSCLNLPTVATVYKGGDGFGEELSLSMNPTSLLYTMTIDASLQRSAGTQRTGVFIPQGNCVYASSENGALFTFGGGGVVAGGIAAPTGTSFLPLLAFQNTFNNTSAPAVFNTIADDYNVTGINYTATGVATPYAGAGKIRNAGTWQTCIDPANGGFTINSTTCSPTTKGYIQYNSTRNAFDAFLTSVLNSGSTPVTGGTPTGSIVAGLVNGASVPLYLVRNSGNYYGMRLYSKQAALISGMADGTYVSTATNGITGSGSTTTILGTAVNAGAASGTLNYSTPAVTGVLQSSGGVTGYFNVTNGIYGFISSVAGIFEVGVKN
ncbi:MAG: tannase/feruloyl esterase family alpha/beta hydrolase [Polaromonas sp.]